MSSWPSRRATPPDAPRLDLNLASAEPGDVFGHVFAGLPGFEHLERPDRRDPIAIARAGFLGPPRPLPHRGVIARSFGHHDLSSIEAFIGGPAATAAEALDARAYAAEGKVAFAADPDLHTAAHEAAHIIQQRQTPGASGPACEQHADAVADLVIAGRSTEPLLSRSPTTFATAGGVQRKGRQESAAVQSEHCDPEGSRHVEVQSAVQSRLKAGRSEMNDAHSNLWLLHQLVALVLNEQARATCADDAVKAAANTLAERIENDRNVIREPLSLLIGIAELAVGLADIAPAAEKMAAALVKIVKGGERALGAAGSLKEEISSSAQVASTALLLAEHALAIHEVQERVNDLLAKKLEIDVASHMEKATRLAGEAMEQIDWAADCTGKMAYTPQFVLESVQRLEVLTTKARALASIAASAAAQLKAVEAVGVRAMSKGTRTQALFERIERLLLAGRGDEIAFECPVVTTIVFRNRMRRRGEGMYRHAQVLSGKQSDRLRTSDKAGAEISGGLINSRYDVINAAASGQRVEYVFRLSPEETAVLLPLASIGLRCRNASRVDFAVDGDDKIVAQSPYLDPGSDAWVVSDDLADMWAGHINDAAGFVYRDRFYRYRDGTFEQLSAESADEGTR